MNINFDEYDNVVDIRLFLQDRKFPERELSFFAGMREELLASPAVGDICIGETDERDGWIAVMDMEDEILIHLKKLKFEKWLVIANWMVVAKKLGMDPLEKDEQAWEPLMGNHELDGPVEDVAAFFRLLLLTRHGEVRHA